MEKQTLSLQVGENLFALEGIHVFNIITDFDPIKHKNKITSSDDSKIFTLHLPSTFDISKMSLFISQSKQEEEFQQNTGKENNSNTTTKEKEVEIEAETEKDKIFKSTKETVKKTQGKRKNEPRVLDLHFIKTRSKTMEDKKEAPRKEVTRKELPRKKRRIISDDDSEYNDDEEEEEDEEVKKCKKTKEGYVIDDLVVEDDFDEMEEKKPDEYAEISSEDEGDNVSSEDEDEKKHNSTNEKEDRIPGKYVNQGIDLAAIRLYHHKDQNRDHYNWVSQKPTPNKSGRHLFYARTLRNSEVLFLDAKFANQQEELFVICCWNSKTKLNYYVPALLDVDRVTDTLELTWMKLDSETEKVSKDFVFNGVKSDLFEIRKTKMNFDLKVTELIRISHLSPKTIEEFLSGYKMNLNRFSESLSKQIFTHKQDEAFLIFYCVPDHLLFRTAVGEEIYTTYIQPEQHFGAMTIENKDLSHSIIQKILNSKLEGYNIEKIDKKGNCEACNKKIAVWLYRAGFYSQEQSMFSFDVGICCLIRINYFKIIADHIQAFRRSEPPKITGLKDTFFEPFKDTSIEKMHSNLNSLYKIFKNIILKK